MRRSQATANYGVVSPDKIEDHNRFYIDEDSRRPPKEFFKFVLSLAKSQLCAGSTVLDVGCACGAFLYHLRSQYPELRLAGIDVSPQFITKAKEVVPEASFSIGDIYTGDQLPKEGFELVFMIGVNYLFPQYELWLRNLLSVTKGSAYVAGIFNTEDLDIHATVRRAGDDGSNTSWNLISEKSISTFLECLNVRHRFFRWALPFENPRVHPDPMRSWTIETKDSGFLVVNGTQMIQSFAVLRIDV